MKLGTTPATTISLACLEVVLLAIISTRSSLVCPLQQRPFLNKRWGCYQLPHSGTRQDDSDWQPPTSKICPSVQRRLVKNQQPALRALHLQGMPQDVAVKCLNLSQELTLCNTTTSLSGSAEPLHAVIHRDIPPAQMILLTRLMRYLKSSPQTLTIASRRQWDTVWNQRGTRSISCFEMVQTNFMLKCNDAHASLVAIIFIKSGCINYKAW